MLQQTRVETVASYWTRFLARFPDVRALAEADEADVLALWSGLGYYRRARSLHAAAKELAARHDGEFPRDAAAARALSGVGPYTAGAVLSIAFDLPEALVDGNVARVFARWFAISSRSPRLEREAWDVARELVPTRGGAGDWNQALMELGATLCTPREPRCDACPVADDCLARRRGLQSELPLPKPRAEPIAVDLASFAVERAGRVLLEQRAPGERMAGLWQLPTVQVGPRGAPRLFADALEVPIEPGRELGVLRHTITRHRIRAVLRSGRCAAQRIPRSFQWFESSALAGLPLTGLTVKSLALLPTAAARE